MKYDAEIGEIVTWGPDKRRGVVVANHGDSYFVAPLNPITKGASVIFGKICVLQFSHLTDLPMTSKKGAANG